MLSRALVGDHGLEVQHVPHRAVIERDAGRTQHVATIARDLERGADVVPFRERNLRTLRGAALFELREPPRDQLRAGQLADGVGEPRLDELSVVQAGGRTARAIACSAATVSMQARAAPHAPHAIPNRASSRQLKRRFESVRFGQARALGDS